MYWWCFCPPTSPVGIRRLCTVYATHSDAELVYLKSSVLYLYDMFWMEGPFVSRESESICWCRCCCDVAPGAQDNPEWGEDGKKILPLGRLMGNFSYFRFYSWTLWKQFVFVLDLVFLVCARLIAIPGVFISPSGKNYQSRPKAILDGMPSDELCWKDNVAAAITTPKDDAKTPELVQSKPQETTPHHADTTLKAEEVHHESYSSQKWNNFEASGFRASLVLECFG